jgi:hypothetical protein
MSASGRKATNIFRQQISLIRRRSQADRLLFAMDELRIWAAPSFWVRMLCLSDLSEML